MALGFAGVHWRFWVWHSWDGLHTTAHGQVEAGLPWELDVVARVHVPIDALGMVPTTVEGQGIDAIWSPRFGSDVGLRIHRRLKDGWTLGGGVEWIRREHDIVVAYSNDSLALSALDSLPGMRSLAYRIPFLGGIRIPLGWNDLEVQSSIGVGVEWKTSETIVTQLVQTEGQDHIVQAYQGRTRYVTMPVIARLDSTPGHEETTWVVFGLALVKSHRSQCMGGKHVVLGFHSRDCTQFPQFGQHWC